MRIAIYAGMFQRDQDGATKTLYRLVDALLAAGSEVAVFGFSITPQDRTGLHLIPLPSTPFPLYRDYRVAVVTPRIRRALDRFAPDIIQVTVPDLVGTTFVRYARRRSIPVVSTYHTVFPEYFRYFHIGLLRPAGWWLTARFYRRLDVVYAPTEIAAFELRRRGLGNIAIWPRGIDLAQFRPEWRDQRFRDTLVGGRRTVILYCGRLVAYKDVKVLAGVYRLFHAGPERPARFVVAGSGPAERWLRRRMPEALFTGYLLGDDLARVYANSDLLLFPSTTESFGNVVLEALASGVPVVVSDRGGPQEIVGQSRAGLIARSGDANDFHRQCRRLMEDGGLYRRMQECGMRYARARSWDVIVGRLVHDLLSRGTGHAQPAAAGSTPTPVLRAECSGSPSGVSRVHR